MSENKFDRWRKCWEAYLLGEQKNPQGEYEQAIIASVDRMAEFELDFRGYEDESDGLSHKREQVLRKQRVCPADSL